MKKNIILGFFAVFVIQRLFEFLIHTVILAPVYFIEPLKSLWRPDILDKMWVMWVSGLVFSFFFTFIFSKGYQGRGILEGVRYGLYMGLLIATPMAYNQYAVYPIPYSVTVQWFLYGVLEYIVLGIVLAYIFKNTSKTQAVA